MITLPYRVVIHSKVDKFLSKLDKNSYELSLKKILKLQKEPIPKNKKHILATKGNAILCELQVDKLRLYYEVSHGIIWVNDIQYDGVVKVTKAYSNHKSGDNSSYPNQQKDIRKMKKEFEKDKK